MRQKMNYRSHDHVIWLPSCFGSFESKSNFISLFEKELQCLSRLRKRTRRWVQHRQFNAIFHNIKVNGVFWMTHKTTWYSINTLIGRGKYSRGWFISPTNIGQHCVILYNPLTANRCVFGQKGSKSNSSSRSPFTLNIYKKIIRNTSLLVLEMFFNYLCYLDKIQMRKYF